MFSFLSKTPMAVIFGVVVAFVPQLIIAQTVSADEASRPNIVLIMADEKEEELDHRPPNPAENRAFYAF